MYVKGNLCVHIHISCCANLDTLSTTLLTTNMNYFRLLNSNSVLWKSEKVHYEKMTAKNKRFQKNSSCNQRKGDLY